MNSISAASLLQIYTTSRSRQTGTDLALLAALVLYPGSTTHALSKHLGLTTAGVGYHLRDLRARDLVVTTKKTKPDDPRLMLYQHYLSPDGQRHFNTP